MTQQPGRMSVCRVASLLLAVSLMTSMASAATRIAIVGSRDLAGSKPGADAHHADSIIALAEAKLSAHDELEILDRQRIREVIQEQKLSLTGLIDAKQAIHVGQLLSVDLFVFVEQSEDGKAVLGSLIYDASTGLRLWDAALSTDGIDAAVDGVVQGVEAAVRKRDAGPGKLRMMSIVGVRNADLPRSADSVCESLSLLLERELARSGAIGILERQRLSWLQQEQKLTATEADRQLLSAALLVDIEFARSDAGVQATLIATNSAGQAQWKATAQSKALDAQLLTRLVESALTELKAPPLASRSDHHLESQRFFREAQQRWSFKEYDRAIQAAESALLLDPGQLDIKIALAEDLLKQAHEVMMGYYARVDNSKGVNRNRMSAYHRAVNLALRALELYDAVSRDIPPPRTASEMVEYQKVMRNISVSLYGFCQMLPYPDDIADKDRAEWESRQAELFAAYITIPRRVIAVWREVIRSNPDNASQFSIWILFNGLAHITRNSKLKTQTAIEFTEAWLSEYERIPAEKRNCDQTRLLNYISQSSELGPLDPGTLGPYLDRLERHSDPLVRLLGLRGKLYLRVGPNSKADHEWVTQFEPIRKEFQRLLEQPEMQNNWLARRTYYEFLYESYRGRDGVPEFCFVWKEVCDAMIARGELHVRWFTRLSHTNAGKDMAAAQQVLLTIDAAIQRCQSRSIVLLDGGDFRGVSLKLEELRFEILKVWPDLNREAGPAPLDTKLLIDITDRLTDNNPFVYLCAPRVLDDAVYCLLATEGELQLVRASLLGGTPTFLGKVAFSGGLRGSSYGPTFVAGSCFCGDKLYAATWAGLFEFDLKSSTASRVKASKSFPTDVVQSVAWFDDCLYAGLEGGYVVAFSPNDETCRTIVSSRRKTKMSPLDDRPAFDVPMLVPDPLRRRMLIQMTTLGSGSGGGGELWAYTSEPNSFKQLTEFSGHIPKHASDIQQDQLILSGGGWVVSLDLVTDKTFTVSNFPLGPKLLPDRRHFFSPFCGCPVHCAGKYWFAYRPGMLRTEMLDRDEERILPIELPPLKQNENFSGWYVAPIDDKRFLWSSCHRVWLVTPKAAPEQPGTAPPGKP